MIVIVGAGAAGLSAAIFARSGACAVTVIERTSDGGRKILISGGGRCNVLPETLAPSRFVTDSPPRLVQRLLRSWPQRAQHEFFEREIGVPLALEAESHKWFPASNRAKDVRDGLVQRARRAGVEFLFNRALLDLRPTARGWQLDTTEGSLEAAVVVLATGGLSVPATGSQGTGLTLASALGHRVSATYPALTPLLASPAAHAHLSGVAVTAHLDVASDRDEMHADGGLLFTHRGYSGPAVLDVSHVAARERGPDDPRPVIRVRWCALTADAWHNDLIAAKGPVVSVLSRHVPRRLAEQLVSESGLEPDRHTAELRRSERLVLIDRLTRYELPWTGTEGYAKAEVTGGGVALDDVDPETLESVRHPGLFLCGEMLDAFGPIGGHNFAWAWATGRLAGLGAAAAR